VPAFIATLGSLYALRGYTLYLTETRAMNLPESILRLASSSLLGIPTPVWLLAAVILAVELGLRGTAWGGHIYAVGYSPEQARRAGLRVGSVLASAYLLSGVLAAFGGLLSVAQLGAVSPTFGNGREFAAIAAAVLGGTSLFGGRGNVFPGTVVGALLIQTVETGLVMLNANPYLYPIVMASVIFAAVLLDSLRTEWVRRAMRRTIRPLAIGA
jgi:ribose transport system permease protein